MFFIQRKYREISMKVFRKNNQNEGHKSFHEKEAQKWDHRFSFSLSLTWFLPLSALALELSFVGRHISFDITNLSNWMEFEAVFAFPIRLFLLMVAITTLLGLYSRSLYLAEQLRLFRLQQNFSFEQLKLSQEQSIRAERQLQLAEKKESFAMYLEHYKSFSAHIDEILYGFKSIHATYQGVSEETIIVNKNRLYSIVFPENNPASISNLTLKSNHILFSKEIGFPINLFSLNEMVDQNDKCKLEHEERFFDEISKDLVVKLGIFIKTHRNDNESFNLGIYLADISRVANLISSLGLSTVEDCKFIGDTTIRFYEYYLEHHET